MGMDRKIEKKKWPAIRIIKYSGGAIFTAFLVYLYALSDSGTRLNVQTERLTIATVRHGEFQEYIPVNGNVLPLRTVYLDAIEGGRVQNRYVEAGSYVEAGQEIIRFENTGLQLNIMLQETQLFEQINNLRNTRLAIEQNRLSLEGQLMDARYAHQSAGRDYQQSKSLREKNLISQIEFADTEDDYHQSRERLDLLMETHRQDSILRAAQVGQMDTSIGRMEQNLALLNETLDNLFIRAPISGLLTSMDAEIGESKSPGQRLGRIDVLDGYKVRATIDEHFITRVDMGVEGEFDLAGSSYRLVITKIYPEVENGRFEVDLEFPDTTPDNIRRGQTIRIRLELGNLEQANLLPRGAFYQATGGRWIFIVDPSREFAYRRDIRLGRQNPQYFEVLEGLAPGELAVISSYDNYERIDQLVLKD